MKKDCSACKQAEWKEPKEKEGYRETTGQYTNPKHKEVYGQMPGKYAVVDDCLIWEPTPTRQQGDIR